MKTRSGFVSNSSSSSYVIIFEKNEYDKLMLELTDLQRDIMDFFRDGNPVQRFGLNDIVFISYVEGNDSTLEYYSPNRNCEKSIEDLLKESEERLDYYDEWRMIKNKINAIPKEKCLQISIAC